VSDSAGRLSPPFIRYWRSLWAEMPDLESVGVLGAYLDVCGKNNRPTTKPDREIAAFAKVHLNTMRRRRADLAAAGYLAIERSDAGSAYRVTLGNRTLTGGGSDANRHLTGGPTSVGAPSQVADRHLTGGPRHLTGGPPLLDQERSQEEQEEQGSLQGRFDDLAMARERRSFAGMSPDQIAERIREVSG